MIRFDLFTVKSPVLVQACAIGFLTSAAFTSFWTTLTFLLSGSPYFYSTLVIGLFALIGIASMCLGPLYSKFIIDKLNPIASCILGELLCLVDVYVGTYTGTFTIAGRVIQAFTIDMRLQTSQISMQTSIYATHPNARSRVNTVYMVYAFCGQLFETAVGNLMFDQAGWIRSGSMSIGFIGGILLILLVRGPWETGWVGWAGGWSTWRKDLTKPPAPAEHVKGGDVEKTAGVEDGKEAEKAAETNEAVAGTYPETQVSTTAGSETAETEKTLKESSSSDVEAKPR